MAFLIILSLLLIGTVVYLSANPLTRSDLPLFLFAFSIVFFLSRFNGLVTIWLGRYPLAGIHVYLLMLMVFLGLVRALGTRPYSRLIALPLPFLFVYGGFSLLSGLVNGGFDGALAASQVLVITMTPAILAWVFVESVGRQPRDSAALRRFYILPLGIVTPLILIVSALLPDIFSGLLGWGLSEDFGGFEGFRRGWSPLGSTILTGCLVVVAFGMALHEAVVNKSKLHTVVAALAATSLLFTVSRAVMIIFIVFNVIYWIMVGNWRTFVRVAALPVMILTAVFGWSLATGSVSFSRFLVLNDQSTGRRADSAMAAADVARENIFLGRGPGLIYNEMRTIWIANENNTPLVYQKAIGSRMSSMEPHNLYLYLMAEHGVFATVAFVLAMLVGLFVVWRTPAGGDDVKRSERAVYVGLWCGLMLVFATASWPLVSPQFSVFFWLFVFSGLHSAAAWRREAAA